MNALLVQNPQRDGQWISQGVCSAIQSPRGSVRYIEPT